jgi:hypothetical protein
MWKKIFNKISDNRYIILSLTFISYTAVAVYDDHRNEKNRINTTITDEFLDEKMKQVNNAKKYYFENKKLPENLILDEIQKELLIYLISKNELYYQDDKKYEQEVSKN